MSKKKKKKFQQRAQQFKSQKQETEQVQAVVSSAPTKTATHMEAKNETIYSAHAKEYRFIWGDLFRVLIVNGVFLLAIVVIYYLNRNSQFLEAWYNQIVK